MLLADILSPDCVLTPLAAGEKDQAVAELVDALHAAGRIDDAPAVLAAVRQREQLRTTGVGAGLALPHGKSDHAPAPTLAVGKPAEPMEFDSVDGKPVSVIVLLVSPTDQPGEHIQALARISRLLSIESTRQAVEKAQTPQQLYEAIVQQEHELVHA